MKYYIDTAKLDEIIKWEPHVCGATSNPSLLAKAEKTGLEFYEDTCDLFKDIFLQVNSYEEVMEYINFGVDKDDAIFKVPLVITNGFNGFTLLKMLVDHGFRTCSTIIYDLHQFNHACDVGAEFSIALHAKNENCCFIDDCCKVRDDGEYETKIIAASFRNLTHIEEVIKSGADYATVPPSIMEEIYSNKLVETDYNKFYGIK